MTSRWNEELKPSWELALTVRTAAKGVSKKLRIMEMWSLQYCCRLIYRILTVETMFIACFWPAWIWCTWQRVARGKHLQFNSIRLSVTEMLGKGSIWFNCESVHDMARCQEKQMPCRMIKSTVSERWTSSTSNGCAAAFVLGTDGRKKREVWTVKGKVSQKFYTCLQMFNSEVYSLHDIKLYVEVHQVASAQSLPFGL